MSFRRLMVFWGAVSMGAGIVWTNYGATETTLEMGRHAVPSLTAWGKIFSCLLLAALGVAYLVWRRPMVQARAILETSPLGTRQVASDLVDWSLYFKTLLVVEACSMILVVALRFSGRALSTLDTWGVVGAGAIVAFVIHLLLLSRRNNDGGTRRD